MPGYTEAGAAGCCVEIPEPRAGPAFEGGAVASEARALRRAGGDVGHGVEGGVGIPAEFVEITAQAGVEIVIQRGLVGFLPVFRVIPQLWPTDDGLDEATGVVQIDGDTTDAGQRVAERIAEICHAFEWPCQFERVDSLTGVRNDQGSGLLLEDHAVAAMFAQETDVDPQGAGAVVTVGDTHEGGIDLGRAAIAHQIHRVGLMVNVHGRPTPRRRAVAVYEMPLGSLGIGKCFQAEPVTQAHRLVIGEDLVARSDNADDVAGVARYQCLAMGQVDVSRHAIVGDGRMDGGFLNGEEPVSLSGVCGHGGWIFSIFSFTIHTVGMAVGCFFRRCLGECS